eukprot:scaffold2146_cov103-Skeletonema_dohrnii-CCMP3373.AAC.5
MTPQKRPIWIAEGDFPLDDDSATYGSCSNVSSRYEKIGRIGQGTYGVVYQARDKQTRDIVALKRCLAHHESSDGFPTTTLREISLLKEIQGSGGHPHIVSLKDVTVSSSRSGVFLVFEYAEHDLATLVDNHFKQHQSSPFRESEVKKLMLQLLDAIKFLHSRCIIHRDLKCSNLLYNHRGELKVADFGLARRLERDSDINDLSKPCNLTPKVVSLWYRPPELLFGLERYDQGIDNFGAGCIMGELLLGRPVMDGRNEMEQIQKMFDFLGPPNEDEWPGLKRMPVFRSGEMELPKQWQSRNTGKHILDVFRRWKRTAGIKLLNGLLKYNPNHRWKAADALDADWFTEMPCPTAQSLMPTFPTKHNKTP